MRKKIIFVVSLFFILCSLFSLSGDASAQKGLGSAMKNLDKAVGDVGLEKELSTSVGTVVKAALALVGTIFLVLTVYAGILWMTAQGAEERIEKARKIITACVIGLFITLSAYAITYFVTTKLGGNQISGGEFGCCVIQPGQPKTFNPGVTQQECSNYASGNIQTSWIAANNCTP